YMPDMTDLLSKNDQDFGSEVLRLTDQQARTRSSGWSAGGGAFGQTAPAAPEYGAPAVTPAPSTAKRGLLVTVTGTTPNAQGYNLIEQPLVSRLKSSTEENRGDREYYVAKAVLVQARSVEETPAIRNKIVSAYQNLQALLAGDSGPANVSGRRPGQPNTAYPGFSEPPRRPGFGPRGGWGSSTPQADAQLLDPNTDEPMGKDMAFRVVFAVVVDIPGETAQPQQ